MDAAASEKRTSIQIESVAIETDRSNDSLNVEKQNFITDEVIDVVIIF